MSLQPHKKLYLIAALLFVIGLAGTFYVVYDGYVLQKDAQRTLIPGVSDFTFTKARTYGIYIEYSNRELINGKPFITDKDLADLECIVTNKDTGERITLVSALGGSSSNGSTGQVMESVYEFTIEKPGNYQLQASFSTNPSKKAVLVIAKDMMSQILGPFFKAMAFTFVSCIGYFLGIWNYRKRRKAKREAQTTQ